MVQAVWFWATNGRRITETLPEVLEALKFHFGKPTTAEFPDLQGCIRF